MSEYIVTCDEEAASWIGNEVDSMKPVVRCRDCACYAVDGLGGYCTQMDFQIADGMEDGFCAWGEKRVDR